MTLSHYLGWGSLNVGIAKTNMVSYKVKKDMLNQKLTNPKKQPQKFYCPYCHRRLWKVGGYQYFLERLGDNKSVWLEDFYCEEHGKILMYVSAWEPENLRLRPAQPLDWEQVFEKQDKVEP